jgi:hypothetical protein
LASYYCTAHGEALRAKYPTAEAVEAALGARVLGDPRAGLFEALEGESFDEGRLSLLESLCPEVLNPVLVAQILMTFDYDEGKVEALRVMRKKDLGDRQEVALAAGRAFDYDEGRAEGRKLLLG